MSRTIVIVDARRTPFGRFRGGLSQVSPVDLAVHPAHAILQDLDAALVDQVIVGNVLSAGHGMNIARQIAVKAGLREEASAFTVNMMCGSGMQAGVLAAQAIRAGDANAVLAGGVESMSLSALLTARPGRGQEPDTSNLVDSLQSDGLRDSLCGEHMGNTAERLASEFSVSREQQDCWAVRSQSLYAQAERDQVFADERIPVASMTADEHPRAGLTCEDLAVLSPVFSVQGTVTAGNSSGINDGAAMFLMADADFAARHGWPVLCEWVDACSTGCDPARMGLGPVHAIRRLLKRGSLQQSTIDTLEINEAFAAQTLACLKELQIEPPDSSEGTASENADWHGHAIRLNAHGGAIAVGHPLAASGARLVTHLAWQIHRGHSQQAIGSLCIGGGMGIAALLRSASAVSHSRRG